MRARAMECSAHTSHRFTTARDSALRLRYDRSHKYTRRIAYGLKPGAFLKLARVKRELKGRRSCAFSSAESEYYRCYPSFHLAFLRKISRAPEDHRLFDRRIEARTQQLLLRVKYEAYSCCCLCTSGGLLPAYLSSFSNSPAVTGANAPASWLCLLSLCFRKSNPLTTST